MQLMDDACSWCRWPCSMRGLPRLLSTSWATENAVMALFLDPLLLADGFSTPHTTLGGCQVHCVPAHGGRERIVNPWRFPQTDRSSSVSQFRCLIVYPCQKTPHNLVCLLIFVLINKIGRPHQNCSMSILHHSWGALFRRVQLKYNLIVINQLFNCTHSSSTVLWSV